MLLGYGRKASEQRRRQQKNTLKNAGFSRSEGMQA